MSRRYVTECEAKECRVRIPRQDIYCKECLLKAIKAANKN